MKTVFLFVSNLIDYWEGKAQDNGQFGIRSIGGSYSSVKESIGDGKETPYQDVYYNIIKLNYNSNTWQLTRAESLNLAFPAPEPAMAVRRRRR